MRNFNSSLKRIEAFIGAWGVKTSEIADADHLLELASRLFEIENSGVESQMADRIAALGKPERKRLAHKNMQDVFGGNPREMTIEPVSSGVSEQGLQKMMNASSPQPIDGAPFNCTGEIDIDPAQLLRKVVSAVISAGRADILWGFPEVLAFFGAKVPLQPDVEHLSSVDQRMFDAAEKWPNRGF